LAKLFLKTNVFLEKAKPNIVPFKLHSVILSKRFNSMSKVYSK